METHPGSKVNLATDRHRKLNVCWLINWIFLSALHEIQMNIWKITKLHLHDTTAHFPVNPQFLTKSYTQMTRFKVAKPVV